MSVSWIWSRWEAAQGSYSAVALTKVLSDIIWDEIDGTVGGGGSIRYDFAFISLCSDNNATDRLESIFGWLSARRMNFPDEGDKSICISTREGALARLARGMEVHRRHVALMSELVTPH